MTNSKRIDKALTFAVRFGGTDEFHHLQWIVDQMVRALTDCPMVTGSGIDAHGKEYQFICQGESDEYLKLVTDAKDGKDGPDTYDWEVGIPP